MIDLVDFNPAHVEVMDLRAEEEHIVQTMDNAYGRLVHMGEDAEKAGTFLHNGRILCCAGFSIMWPGVADGWIIPSIYVSDAPISFCKTIRAYCKEIMETMNVHRLQTTSYDDAFHKRWMEWLGFERECIMKKYTQEGTNMCLYAMVA